jgi:hypothetical protein
MEITDPSNNPRRLACPACAGNIALRGSSEIELVVCMHCGANIDTSTNDYKIIAKNPGALRRRGTPTPLTLELGMIGSVKGRRYEIIGRIQYKQVDEGVYVWDEYLLFSPEYGYGWLVAENGHFVFLSPTKSKPEQKHTSLTYRKTFNIGPVVFQVFEKGTARVHEVEGELTWAAKIGDAVEFVDAIAPPLTYCIEWTEKEIEYFTGSYVETSDIWVGFGLSSNAYNPLGVYPCQPYTVHPAVAPMSKIGWGFSGVFLALLLWAMTAGGGVVRAFKSFNGQDLISGFETEAFFIDRKGTVCRVDFHAGLHNAWAWFDVDVVKAEEGDVLDFGKQVSYYSGVEGGESWSEGSRGASQVFKIQDTGSYRLRVSGTGGEGESLSEGFAGFGAWIKVRTGYVLKRYYLFGLILGMMVPLFSTYHRYKFEHERWASEEDDDED